MTKAKVMEAAEHYGNSRAWSENMCSSWDAFEMALDALIAAESERNAQAQRIIVAAAKDGIVCEKCAADRAANAALPAPRTEGEGS